MFRSRSVSRRVAASALAVVAFAGGCSSDATSEATSSTTSTVPPLEVAFVDPTFPTGTTTDALFVTDVSCGDHDRNVFDIVVPAEPAEAPEGGHPWVVYLHGGGFTEGDKSGFWEDAAEPDSDVAALVESGVAVAAMNYRLLDEVDDDGVIKPMTDVARCLQYLRYHGPSTFGLDAENVVLTGGSAGAGTALWLALHDDLAEPDSEDPVSRQSTRPVAVAVDETQATYDLFRWLPDVFGDYSDTFGELTVIDVARAIGQEQRLLSFYGAPTAEDLTSPEFVEYRANVDMLGLMSPDDPPIWVQNVRTEEAMPVDLDLFFHHPHHARALEQRAEEAGVDATVTWGYGATAKVPRREFVLDALGVHKG